jgi:hypothetical protein
MILPALLLAQAALAAEKTTVLATKSFPAARISRIEIHVEAGSVAVSARPGKDALVRALKPADSEGHCELKLHLEGGTLELEARKPQGSAAVCDGGFEVAAPAGADLEAYSGSGDIAITGMAKTVKVRAGSGSVRLKGLRGQAYAMTGSGAIDAELPSAAFDARTGAGDIRVSLTQPSGLVSARAGSGNITITAPKAAKIHVRASTASGTVANPYGDDPKAPLVVEAFSGSGDITLKSAK